MVMFISGVLCATLTSPLLAVNVILDLMALNSSSDNLAPLAVTSLLIFCVATCGLYLAACDKILNCTRNGFEFSFDWFFN